MNFIIDTQYTNILYTFERYMIKNNDNIYNYKNNFN